MISWLNPWFSVVALLIGVAGILLYLFGGPKGEIAYYDETFTVFDAAKSGDDFPIRLLDEAGNPITTSVHALKVIFVNTGGLAAEPSSVRSPLKVVLEKDPRIVSTAVQYQTAPLIMQASARELSAQPKVEVKWEHFDPGDRLAVLILYVAPEVIKPKVEGRIHQFSLVKADRVKSSSVLVTLPIAVTIGMFSLFLWWFFILALRDLPGLIRGREYKNMLLLLLALLFVGAFATGASTGAYYFFTQPFIAIPE